MPTRARPIMTFYILVVITPIIYSYSLDRIFLRAARDNQYLRNIREDPEHSFNQLGPALLIEDYDNNNIVEAVTPDKESMQFIETPVVLSNPLWSIATKANDFYRWVRRY
ncbi:hypothetical protein WR25_04945 [Diploscapter pachys]|uniref:Uncharacterized protein n=1 Tax=Diploscapter pachys TaxID=2018661 RepID=A0A2A2JQF7_9BILA|nr:hypothetical protein WR25_04945 [Diploscapter pachys]